MASEEQPEQEESRFNLFTDALNQASHKIVNNILRYDIMEFSSFVFGK